MSRGGAFALVVALAAGCSRGGCKHEVAAAPPPRDDVVTALVHFRDSLQKATPAESRRSLALLVEQVSAMQDASFAATGDVYVHHVYPEPDWSCIAARTCFFDYVRFLGDAEWAAHPPPAEALLMEKAETLSKQLSLAELEGEVARRVAYVESELPKVASISFRGDADAERVVYLLSTGHPIEARRDAAIARILSSHPKGVRFGEVKRASAPALFDALGHRLTAVALIDGRLRKDVVGYEQWLELVFPNEPFPAPTHRHADLPIVDAHEHLFAGGAARLIAIERDEGFSGAVIAALPTPTSFNEPNDVVLAAARTDPPFLFPFATVDELSPTAAESMRELITRGARGLKLLTGHDDFHRARGSPPLDPATLHAVFRELEQRHLPVLWHVNTHLFVDGFLAALRTHPALTFVAPHFAGYLTYAPHILRRLLLENPNLNVDLSLGAEPRYLRRGIEDLSANAAEWRKLFTELPDRFLFGIDMVVTADTARSHGRMLVNLYRDLLEEDEFDLDFFPARGFSSLAEESQHRARMKGLALPREVLAKIYAGNANRLYGTPH